MDTGYESSFDIETECKLSIVRLHKFFVDWFTAARAQRDSIWNEFELELDPSFVLITPGGQVLPRETLLPALRANYGKHRETRFEIEVRNVVVRHVTSSVVVACYEEWQWLGEVQTARQSTAVFARIPEDSGNLQWLHVHETWLPGMAPPAA